MYNFTVTGQRGTLWWHAHVLWLRATVHGAIVILPKPGLPYPFPKPHREEVIVLGINLMRDTHGMLQLCYLVSNLELPVYLSIGEWWKSDTENVINEALKSGLAPNVSDAHVINGHPGLVPNCPSQGS